MDRERILTKFDELEGYLKELEKIKPIEYTEYKSSIEKKRASERLLQISIETVLDICNLLLSSLRLGIPIDEEDVFTKLEDKKIITQNMRNILTNMKGFRNLLVHKYGVVKDELVFELLSERLGDFDKFEEEIIRFLKKNRLL